LVVTLPLRVRLLDQHGAGTNLSLILGVGAFVALVANPIFGKMSDVYKARRGSRKPWLLGGQLVQLVGIAIVASATRPAMLIAGWCVAQLGFNAFLSSALPILADEIPARQRGVVSGLLGVCIPLGQLVGVYMVQAFAPNMTFMFGAPAAIALALTAPLLFLLKEHAPSSIDVAEKEEIHKESAAGFLLNSDFFWVWISRFFFVLGNSFVFSYLLYYLIEQLGETPESAPHRLFNAMFVSTVAFVIASVGGGLISDAVKQRKRFVAVAALLYGVGLTFLGFSSNTSMFYAAMAVVGLGQGLYLGVDMALVVNVLPNPKNTAKDMGLFNIANALPQSLAPVAVPFVLQAGGGRYSMLFLLAGVLSVIGAIVVLPVKKS
jgi:MFS family permease